MTRILFTAPNLPREDGTRFVILRYDGAKPGEARTTALFPFRGRIYQLDRYGIHRVPGTGYYQ